MSTLPDIRPSREMDHPWHVALNAYKPTEGHLSWLYEAKALAYEVPRLALLFGMERRGELPAVHRQCSLSDTEPVPDNHLTCCLGVECRVCPHLAAIEAAETLAPEDRDLAKAWTCAGHIVSSGGDHAKEGYLCTVDDRMFWDSVYESLAAGDPREPR